MDKKRHLSCFHESWAISVPSQLWPHYNPRPIHERETTITLTNAKASFPNASVFQQLHGLLAFFFPKSCVKKKAPSLLSDPVASFTQVSSLDYLDNQSGPIISITLHQKQQPSQTSKLGSNRYHSLVVSLQ